MPRDQVALKPRELARVSLSPATLAAIGVDLVATVTNLHRAFRDVDDVFIGQSIWVETNHDLRGLSWDRVKVVGPALLGPGSGVKEDSIPTLVVDAHDNLWMWYHDIDYRAIAMRSEDWGKTWDWFAGDNPYIDNFAYPRAVIGPERQLVVGHNGSELVVRGSDTYWQSTGALATFEAPRQLASLELDRHGYYHLLYQDSAGLVQHRYAQDPASWSAPTALAAGLLVSGTVGDPIAAVMPRGLVATWVGGALNILATNPDYSSLSGLATLPGLGGDQQVVGLTFDRHDNAWLMAQLDGADMDLRWSNDYGATWEVP